jgi:hypothetical protein
VTEPNYFRIIGRLYPDVTCSIKFARTPSSNCSNPHEVLKFVKQWLRDNGPLVGGDELWLVVDKDCWTEEQLGELRNWASEPSQHGVRRDMALSDPKFEYWLLLHFEDSNVASSKECTQKLKKHLPQYNKRLNDRDFTLEHVQQAVARARRRDGCGTGSSSDVYRLVERILSCRSS